MLYKINSVSNKDLWLDAVVAARTEGNLGVIKYELNTNLFNFYNLKINLFLFLSTIPFVFYEFFIKKI